MRFSNHESLVTDSLESDRWHQQATGASGAQCPMTGQISNRNEWTQLPRSTSVKNFVCQNGDFVLNLLWDSQSVKSGKRVGDVVCGSHMVDEPCRRIQYRLKTMYQISGKANQYGVSIVQSGQHQGDHQRLERGWRY